MEASDSLFAFALLGVGGPARAGANRARCPRTGGIIPKKIARRRRGWCTVTNTGPKNEIAKNEIAREGIGAGSFFGGWGGSQRGQIRLVSRHGRYACGNGPFHGSVGVVGRASIGAEEEKGRADKTVGFFCNTESANSSDFSPLLAVGHPCHLGDAGATSLRATMTRCADVCTPAPCVTCVTSFAATGIS